MRFLNLRITRIKIYLALIRPVYSAGNCPAPCQHKTCLAPSLPALYLIHWSTSTTPHQFIKTPAPYLHLWRTWQVLVYIYYRNQVVLKKLFPWYSVIPIPFYCSAFVTTFLLTTPQFVLHVFPHCSICLLLLVSLTLLAHSLG